MNNEDVNTAGRIRRMAEVLEKEYGSADDRDFLRKVRDDAMDTLIKTVLSQNTNDRNSEKAFAGLKAAYPTWDLVASADERQIASLIKVGGLAPQKSRRIKSILAAIREATGDYNLSMIDSMKTEEAWDFLMSLDGVGPKTAACTLLFAFGRPVFPVDTHIHRISTRAGLAGHKDTAEKVQRRMQHVVPADLVESFHVNLIHLGRAICHPKDPECDRCPIAGECPRIT